MKRFFQALILLFGVTLYSQDSLSIKDGAHGYDKDFVLNIFLKTDAKKSFGTTTADKQLLSSGTTTETKVNKLIDNTQNFKSSVNVGDVVRNKTDNTYAFIWGEDPDGDGKYEITSDTSLTLSTDIMESGEEYEIVATVNPTHMTRIRKYAKKHRISLYEIGYVTKGKGVFYQKNQKLIRIRDKGWHHFQ